MFCVHIRVGTAMTTRRVLILWLQKRASKLCPCHSVNDTFKHHQKTRFDSNTCDPSQHEFIAAAMRNACVRSNAVTTVKKVPRRHESIAHATKITKKRDPSQRHVDKMMRLSHKTRSRVTSLKHFLQAAQRKCHIPPAILADGGEQWPPTGNPSLRIRGTAKVWKQTAQPWVNASIQASAKDLRSVIVHSEQSVAAERSTKSWTSLQK